MLEGAVFCDELYTSRLLIPFAPERFEMAKGAYASRYTTAVSSFAGSSDQSP